MLIAMVTLWRPSEADGAELFAWLLRTVITRPIAGMIAGTILLALTLLVMAAIRRSGGRDWDARTGGVGLVAAEPDARPRLDAARELASGVRLATLYAPDLDERWAALRRRDPAVDLPSIETRMHLIFRELERAVTLGRASLARAYLSDAAFESLRSRIAALADAELVYRLDDGRLAAIELVRVASDRHHDALSFRVERRGREAWFSTRDRRRLVRGDPRRERVQSEHWTLIREATARGRARDEPTCPACRQRLRLTPAGFCVHCEAELGVGEHDWVLDRIDADEAYAG